MTARDPFPGDDNFCPCRLCGKPARHAFNRVILERYDTPYWECSSCGSLQTSPPHWLEEAYAFRGVHIDVEQASRGVRNWICLAHYLRAYGVTRERCLDFGGSSGLLTRLMRDSGFDFYCFDPYETPRYADYFSVGKLRPNDYSVITAFEVFEHFPDPRSDLGRVLQLGVDLVVFTTLPYAGQGPDWDYLVPASGQHVFFYTERALERFGRQFGYTLRKTRAFLLYVRDDGAFAQAGHSAVEIPPASAGALLGATCWDSAATQQDAQYVRDLFLAELRSGARKA